MFTEERKRRAARVAAPNADTQGERQVSNHAVARDEAQKEEIPPRSATVFLGRGRKRLSSCGELRPAFPTDSFFIVQIDFETAERGGTLQSTDRTAAQHGHGFFRGAFLFYFPRHVSPLNAGADTSWLCSTPFKPRRMSDVGCVKLRRG